jgi:hypothetical protein
MNSLPIQHVATTPKKSNKIWISVVIPLILCCLCLLISGVAGYFYFQYNAAGIGEILNPLVQPPQPNEVKPGEEVRCEIGGFAFKTIPNYKVLNCSEFDSMVSLESNDMDFSNPNFVIGEGPEILLSGWALTSDSDPSFENFVKRGNDDMRLRYNAAVSGESQVSVEGLMGIAYDYDYDLPGAGTMKARVINVEVSPKQFFFILCRSTIGKWDKTLADFEAVTNSLTFFEPVPSPTQIP